MLVEFATVLNFVIALALIAMVTYIWVRYEKVNREWTTQADEIKSKIGSIVRQLNKIFESEYSVDLNQQADINKLKLSHML